MSKVNKFKCVVCNKSFTSKGYLAKFCSVKCKYKMKAKLKKIRYNNDEEFAKKEREYQKAWRKKKWEEDPEFKDRCYRSTMKYYMKRFNVCGVCKKRKK